MATTPPKDAVTIPAEVLPLTATPAIDDLVRTGFYTTQAQDMQSSIANVDTLVSDGVWPATAQLLVAGGSKDELTNAGLAQSQVSLFS